MSLPIVITHCKKGLEKKEVPTITITPNSHSVTGGQLNVNMLLTHSQINSTLPQFLGLLIPQSPTASKLMQALPDLEQHCTKNKKEN